MDGVVGVGDGQLGGVGNVRAGGSPDWPGQVAVTGMSRGEVVVLVLTRALLQAVLAVVLRVRETLPLLVVLPGALEQGDALVLLAVDDLVAEGGVLLTADAAEEGGGWGSTWWGSRHLLSSSTITSQPRLLSHFQSFLTVTNLSRLCCMSHLVTCHWLCPSVGGGLACRRLLSNIQVVAGPGSRSSEWRAGFSEPVLLLLRTGGAGGILYRPAQLLN